MRSIFVEKSYTKCGLETIPRLLTKKSKLHISLNQECTVLKSLFLLYDNFESYQIIVNQAAEHFLLPNIKLFKKTKSSLELVSLPHVLHDF